MFPHLKALHTVLGRISRPSQFTETQGSCNAQQSFDSDDHIHMALMDDEFQSGQAGGGISDELTSHIPLDESDLSDDNLVQFELDEMQETISSLTAFQWKTYRHTVFLYKPS